MNNNTLFMLRNCTCNLLTWFMDCQKKNNSVEKHITKPCSRKTAYKIWELGPTAFCTDEYICYFLNLSLRVTQEHFLKISWRFGTNFCYWPVFLWRIKMLSLPGFKQLRAENVCSDLMRYAKKLWISFAYFGFPYIIFWEN